MFELSWLLPTKIESRPFEQFAQHAVRSINNAMEGHDIKYEIVVASKTEPPKTGDYFTWAKEDDGNDGAVHGFNCAYWRSTGKYFIVVIDDWVYNDSFLKVIDFLQSDTFKHRRFKLTTLNAPNNFDYSVSSMPEPARPPRAKELWPVWGFVAGERRTVVKELHNYLANPRFRHRYWDNYLPFYIGHQGEFPLLCEGTHASQLNNDYNSYHHNDDYDLNIFRKLVENNYAGYQEYV